MKILTDECFFKTINLLEENIGQGKTFSKGAVVQWLELLKKENITDDDFTDAAVKLYETCKFLPAYSEIIAAVRAAKNTRLENEYQTTKAKHFNHTMSVDAILDAGKKHGGLVKAFISNVQDLLHKRVSPSMWNTTQAALLAQIKKEKHDYPSCGQCSYYTDHDNCCKAQTVNYYGSHDKSSKPRKAQLAVSHNQIASGCGFYDKLG